jgi:hypothetical protein
MPSISSATVLEVVRFPNVSLQLCTVLSQGLCYSFFPRHLKRWGFGKEEICLRYLINQWQLGMQPSMFL